MDNNINGKQAIDLRQCLATMRFPANKNTIASHMQQNELPADLIRLVDQFPDHNFNSLEDVIQAFSAKGQRDQKEETHQYGVNDTSRVGENAYLQRGVEESAGSEYRSSKPSPSGFNREEYSGGVSS